MAELTSAGLIIRRYPEILTALQEAMKNNISSELIFDEDTILGQITQILANEYAAMEEMLQSLDDSMDRDKAEGASLDKLLYLIGLDRLQPAKSSGFVQFICRNNTTIPLGTITRNPSSGDRFFSTSPVTAIPSAALDSWWKPEVANNRMYTITVEGNNFSYTSGAGATATDIVSGLAAAASIVSYPTFSVAVDLIDGNQHLKVSSKSGVDNISSSATQYLTPERVRISVPAESEVFGSIPVPQGSITELVSGLGGVYSLRNDKEFGVGRLRETDDQFRLRATQSLSVSGSSTYSAIYQALTAIPEASTVLLLENEEPAPDINGLPPHSFEAIVDIPDTPELDIKVAEVLWAEKPIGIQSYGTRSVTIIDDIGYERVLSFSRPEDEYIAVRVTYTLYDEEVPSENLDELIKDAVLNFGYELTAGEDVIPRRFIGGVYANTDGLDTVTVEAQVLPSAGATPVAGSWSQNKINITPRKTAAFNRTQVYTVDAS